MIPGAHPLALLPEWLLGPSDLQTASNAGSSIQHHSLLMQRLCLSMEPHTISRSSQLSRQGQDLPGSTSQHANIMLWPLVLPRTDSTAPNIRLQTCITINLAWQVADMHHNDLWLETMSSVKAQRAIAHFTSRRGMWLTKTAKWLGVGHNREGKSPFGILRVMGTTGQLLAMNHKIDSW